MFYLILFISSLFSKEIVYQNPNKQILKVINNEENIYFIDVKDDKYRLIQLDKDFNEKILLYTHQFGNSKEYGINDITIWNEDLIIATEKSLLKFDFIELKNISIDDEYNLKDINKIRSYQEIDIDRDNNLILNTTRRNVFKRDTIQGTPSEYSDSFTEIVKYNENSNKVLLQGSLTQEGSQYPNSIYDVNIDESNNIWLSCGQKGYKFGLTKISTNEVITNYDIQKYNQNTFNAQPQYSYIKENKIIIEISPKKDNNYQGALSIFDINNETWENDIEIYKLLPNYQNISNFFQPDIIKGFQIFANNEFFIFNKNNLLVKSNNNYKFVNLVNEAKIIMKNENYTIAPIYFVLQFQNRILAVISQGIIDITESLSVNEAEIIKYKIVNGQIYFENIKEANYKIFNLLGQNLTQGNFVNALSTEQLQPGLNLVQLNNNPNLIKINK